MPGKKKKASRRRGTASVRRQNKSPPDLTALLSQADAAMESSDVPAALSLYMSATSLLRTKLESTPSSSSSMMNTDKPEGGTPAILLAQVLGKTGEAHVSMGDSERAHAEFNEAISLLQSHPIEEATTKIQIEEMRAGLYLYLGQLSEAEEALDCYKKSIADLESCIKSIEGKTLIDTKIEGENMDEDNDESNPETFLGDQRKLLCGAYCSMAELYLTDLCYETDAEQQCESYLAAALKIPDGDTGKPTVDALQTVANLRISQNRLDDAVSNMLDVYQSMKSGCEGLSALVGLSGSTPVDKTEANTMTEQARELVDVEAASSLPGFEFRCQSVKLYLECANGLKSQEENTATEQQCVSAAIHVLGSLLAENDDVVEVWYLLGCAFMACNPPDSQRAREYWEQALEMLEKVKEGMDQDVSFGGTADDSDDDSEATNEELAEINCQLEEVTDKLSKLDSEHPSASENTQETVDDTSMDAS